MFAVDILECPECGKRYKHVYGYDIPICYHVDSGRKVVAEGCQMISLGIIKESSLQLKGNQTVKDWLYKLTSEDFK